MFAYLEDFSIIFQDVLHNDHLDLFPSNSMNYKVHERFDKILWPIVNSDIMILNLC